MFLIIDKFLGLSNCMNFIVLYHGAVKDLHEDDIFTTATLYLLSAGDGEYADIFYSVLFKEKIT